MIKVNGGGWWRTSPLQPQPATTRAVAKTAAVGPFVFFDHLHPTTFERRVPQAPTGESGRRRAAEKAGWGILHEVLAPPQDLPTPIVIR